MLVLRHICMFTFVHFIVCGLSVYACVKRRYPWHKINGNSLYISWSTVISTFSLVGPRLLPLRYIYDSNLPIPHCKYTASDERDVKTAHTDRQEGSQEHDCPVYGRSVIPRHTALTVVAGPGRIYPSGFLPVFGRFPGWNFPPIDLVVSQKVIPESSIQETTYREKFYPGNDYSA